MDKIMTCNCYVNDMCVCGSCPTALYNTYGPAYGFNLSCEECDHHEGLCDDCIFQYSEVCPLEHLLAEAEPLW